MCLWWESFNDVYHIVNHLIYPINPLLQLHTKGSNPVRRKYLPTVGMIQKLVQRWIIGREITCSSCSNNITFGVPGVQNQPSFVVTIGGIEICKGHVDATQPHLPTPCIKVKNDTHINWDCRVLCLGQEITFRKNNEEKKRKSNSGRDLHDYVWIYRKR